jgi:hypothetical protein
MANRDLFKGAPPQWLDDTARYATGWVQPVAKPVYDFAKSHHPEEFRQDLSSEAQKFKNYLTPKPDTSVNAAYSDILNNSINQPSV